MMAGHSWAGVIIMLFWKKWENHRPRYVSEA